MMRSILQKEKKCIVCGSTHNIHNHHIYFGSNRKNSEKNGFVVWLCGYHHNLSNFGVHFNHELDIALKQLCQKKFEENHTREEFMKIIGRNYL